MTIIKSNSFSSKFRTIFWPIHNHELGKFIPMCGLMFCVLFNQNILRILKDSILISEISAEVVSFTKVYCVTPAAALFVIIYAKMLNHCSFEKIYGYLITFFIVFFILFAFIIYPNVHIFHINPNSLEQSMGNYPHLKWYIALIGNWSYVVFYTLSELWPNIFYVLLFWQFANELTTTEEAKRFYTLFSLFGNSALIFVGFLMLNLSSANTIAKYFFTVPDNKTTLVKVSTSFVVVAAIISYLLVRFISKNVFTNPTFYAKAKAGRSTKDGMGLVESFRYIIRSKYLWLMLICSAAFGLSINLVEAVWKAKIKELYPTVNSYAEFNSLYILWTGVTIMVMTIIGNNIMRSHSWFVAAVISPVIVMVTGTLFFILIVFDHQILSLFDSAILMTPLALAVSIGALQNILAKGTKYSLWDTSKEMLYIPLDRELKTKGKAAVDVISSKVGKSSSGLIQSVIFTLVPTATFSSISPFLMGVFIVVCIAWIYSVRKIYFEYKKIV
ncbi:Npt1/Npt2 family nucleotide transporter [Candidatus Tisiphia endosymbiont of Hybos culiciformis]|uniref:Npt1/Npt2 family nucleotide transporter n=1 Tax=Candidatus Tisiphia endosymbiont of Hybos culiciformis TaxID=3139331 RepID=UPI003CCAAB09